MERSWTHRLDYAEAREKDTHTALHNFYDSKLDRSICKDWTISGFPLFLRYSPLEGKGGNAQGFHSNWNSGLANYLRFCNPLMPSNIIFVLI